MIPPSTPDGIKSDFLILIVDDDEDHLHLLERFAGNHQCRVLLAKNGQEAIELLTTNQVDVVITDMVMPGKSGMDVLLFVRRNSPKTDVMVMTGYSKEYSYMDLIHAGASDFINKPFQKDEFSAKLQRVFTERTLRSDLQKEIAARRQTEEELIKAKALADSASMAKTEFINTMSHELRTPMNGIMGFTQILQESELTLGQQEYLRFISVSAERLLKMINKILDYADLMSQQRQQFQVPFSVQALCLKILAGLKNDADLKDIDLLCEIDTTIDAKLIGEDAVLAQVLHALLENALLFSDSSEVTLNVTQESCGSPETSKLLFSVTDQGPGIPHEVHDFIFEPFTQLQCSMTRDHEGAGLGLALSKRFVELMHGKIWVESELGKGSTFYFTAEFGRNHSLDH